MELQEIGQEAPCCSKSLGVDFRQRKDSFPSNNGYNSRTKQRVKIRVAEKCFETYQETLICRCGSIFNRESTKSKYFDSTTNEYVFDRNSKAFEAIFTYMQCGILTKPKDITVGIFIGELTFFGFTELAKSRYQDEIMIVKSEKNEPKDLITKLYFIIEYPETNLLSRCYSLISAAIVLLSIITYCISSYPDTTIENNKYKFTIIEYFCNIWFTVELIVRFLCCPVKREFFKTAMNIIDILSIFPFYLDVIMDTDNNNAVALAMLRVFRIIRVIRIFKLSRYSAGMKVALTTLRTSAKEMVILLFFMLIGITFFSALIYFCENDDLDSTNKFKSIPHVFWFSIVTMTTVGYGDMFPITASKRTV